MAPVRRCDNPACTNGPAGTPNVSATANPDGWFTVTVSPVVGGQPQAADACSAECVAAVTQAALTG